MNVSRGIDHYARQCNFDRGLTAKILKPRHHSSQQAARRREQIQNWEQEKWIDALSRSKLIDHLHSCSTRTQSWFYHQSNFKSFDTDTAELENGLWIKPVSFHLWIRKNRHRDSERSTGQDQFMNQEWYCTSKAIAQIMIVMSYFNLRRAQDPNLVFHQKCRDAVILFDKTLASALDKVDTFAGEVLSEKKTPDFKFSRRRTLGERIDLAHVIPAWRTSHTEGERSKSISQFQLDETGLEFQTNRRWLPIWPTNSHKKIQKQSITIL